MELLSTEDVRGGQHIIIPLAPQMLNQHLAPYLQPFEVGQFNLTDQLVKLNFLSAPDKRIDVALRILPWAPKKNLGARKKLTGILNFTARAPAHQVLSLCLVVSKVFHCFRNTKLSQNGHQKDNDNL